MNSELGPIMQSLIERLCDRRALGPLRHLLAGWPMTMSTSDEWHDLWAALRNLRGVAGPQLLAEERALVEQAYRIVDRSIRAAGQLPGGPSA
jgi:hypothetical protein